MGTALPRARPPPVRPERKLKTRATTYVVNVLSLGGPPDSHPSMLPF
jgi:hypothetical protein